MVLSYFGHHAMVAQCRDVCVGGRGGVSARTLADAARSYGLTCKGLRIVPGLFRQVPLPAIAHWKGNHFVVVERIGRRRVSIVDPAWGRRRLTISEFEASLGSVALLLEPGPDFKRAGRTQESTARMLLRMIMRVPGMRAVMGQIVAVTVLLQMFGLVLPVATALVVDELIGLNTRDDLVMTLGLALVVAVASQMVAGYLRALLLIYLRGRIDWHILVGFVNHLYSLPLRFFHQRTTGDIAVRVNSVALMRNLLANDTMTSMLDAVLVIGYVVLMYFFDAYLATAVLLVLVAQVVVTALVTGRVRDITARTETAKIAVQDYILQTLTGIGTIKASGAEPHVVAGLRTRILTWTASALQRSHLDAGVDTFTGVLRMLAPLLVLWVGVWRVLLGEISVGTLLGFMWLSAAVLGPLSTLLQSWQRLQGATVQIERFGDVLRATPEPVGVRPAPPRRADGARVELHEVSFGYDNDSASAVQGVTVTVEPGQRVAIVGRSGAGKTTLAMLILGLYVPTEGTIRFDGVKMDDLNLVDLRKRFGAVLQEPFTMRATVRHNIAFAHPEASDEEVRWAAGIADIDHDIDSLPLGYDTSLAERGVGLSGGQLQRLSIARALIGRPDLLILDEATSHLDAETERRIVNNLRDVACTQVVIAHRLSTVRDADLILVLDAGRMVESGRHDELVDNGGPYASLVAAQLGGGVQVREPAGQVNDQAHASALSELA